MNVLPVVHHSHNLRFIRYMELFMHSISCFLLFYFCFFITEEQSILGLLLTEPLLLWLFLTVPQIIIVTLPSGSKLTQLFFQNTDLT